MAITGSGHVYRDWVANYIKHNFGSRGVEIYSEVSAGKSIIGKNRSIDLLVLDVQNNNALAIERKFQEVGGTADEKIVYALKDAESMQMFKYVVYGGIGWSTGIKHMLEAHELACFAEPLDLDPNDFNRYGAPRKRNGVAPRESTIELDHILAMRFGWWDLLVAGKTPY